MGRYKKLARNTVLVFIGQAGAKVIGLLMLPLYTRWLSVEEFGVSDLITVYSTALVGVVACCIYDAIFIFPKNKDKKSQSGYFSTGLLFLLISFLFFALVFYFIGLFCKYKCITNSFVNYQWCIYAMLVSQILLNVIQQFTRSIDKLFVFSITGLVVTTTTAFYAFLFIPQMGVIGYVISIIIAQLSGAIYAFVASKSYTFLNPSCISVNKCKEMLQYSIPLIPNGIMWWIVGSLNRPFLESYSTFYDIGLYAIANKFPGILQMLFAVFLNSWQISVVEEFGKIGYADFYNRVFRFVISISIIGLLLLTLFSKVLVLLLAAPEYSDSWRYIPILSLGVIFNYIGGIVGCVFSATRESKYYFYSSAWSALFAICANYLLIPMYGILGASMANMLSFAVMAISRIVYSHKYVSLDGIKVYLLELFLVILVYLFLIFNIYRFIIYITALFVIGVIFFTLRNDFYQVIYKIKK